LNWRAGAPIGIEIGRDRNISKSATFDWVEPDTIGNVPVFFGLLKLVGGLLVTVGEIIIFPFRLL